MMRFEFSAPQRLCGSIKSAKWIEPYWRWMILRDAGTGAAGAGKSPAITTKLRRPLAGDHFDCAEDSAAGEICCVARSNCQRSVDVDPAADSGGDGAVFEFLGAAENLLGVGLMNAEGGAAESHSFIIRNIIYKSR